MKITMVLLVISFGLCLISMADSVPLKQNSVVKGRQNNGIAGTSVDDDEEDPVDDIEDALDGEDDDDDDDHEDEEEDGDDENEDEDDDGDYLERVLDDFVGDGDDDEDDDDSDDDDDDDDSDLSGAANPQHLPAEVQQDLADPSNIIYDDTEDFAPSDYAPEIDPNNDDAVRIPSNQIETNDDEEEEDDDDDDEEDEDDDDFISNEAIEARDSSVKNSKKSKKKLIKNKKHN